MRLLHLEGLRGVSAYGVFLIHFLDGYWDEALALPKFGLKFNIYVALFFILSGRVLTVSILKSGNYTSLAISICKRPFRLGLPLIAVTIMNLIVAEYRGNSKSTIFQSIFRPIYFMIYNGDLLYPIPGVAWTIPHEFAGSMIVYVTTLLLLYFDSKKSKILILFILISFTIITHSWISHFLVGLAFAVFEDDLLFLKQQKTSMRMIAANLFKLSLGLIVFLLCFDSPIGIGPSFSEFLRSYQVIFALF